MTDEPKIRIADAERAEAAEMLDAHHGAGRLDAAEHAERTTAAWRAKYSDDLAVLFADLPAPHPSSLTGVHLPVDWNADRRVPQPSFGRTRSGRQVIAGTFAVAALALVLAGLVVGQVSLGLLIPLVIVGFVLWRR